MTESTCFQLEQNLVLLGYDPDGDVVVDEVFDDATETAIERWETALGLEATGEVPEARIVFVPGRVVGRHHGGRCRWRCIVGRRAGDGSPDATRLPREQRW